MATAVLWLRRDLRLSDNPALAAALAEGDRLVPCFCLDRRLLGGRFASVGRTGFMLGCLRELDRSLRKRGSALHVLEGRPESEIPRLCGEVGADVVHVSADTGPFAADRDDAVSEALERTGARLRRHPGLFIVDDPTAVTTLEGRPFTVFTPFHRAWLRAPRRQVHPAPASLPPLPEGLSPTPVPELTDLGMTSPVSPAAGVGERAARAVMDEFLADGVASYGERRDILADAGTSKLSPYLHFGVLSPREIETLLGSGEGAEEFRRQLCWRDFYAHVLSAFPGNRHDEHQPRLRRTIRWRESDELFAAWRDGRTGYPVVDAAMRQLRREGWMHNRARLIVGSFLTKDLGIDWRRGEQWFMENLLDGDLASNNGNWQWIASVGVDPQPAARRLFNPTRQQLRFDPDGRYVRRYVDELRAVPDRYLAEPWTMPEDVQRSAGCVIGRDYPEPVVDHAEARREALARYAQAFEATAESPR